LRRRVLIGLSVLVGLTALGLGGLLVYGAVQIGNVPRVRCDACAEPDEGDPINVLVVGSDSRTSVTDDAESFGTPQEVSGQRSDTIMVLRLGPGRDAALLSIPRDLWVPIASGGTNRINTAFEQGPDNLVRTVGAALGMPIHHFVEVQFAGFRELVDAVDGVAVFFATPARDTVTGLLVEAPGCVDLNGEAALAYVRSRNYETQANGEWTGGGAGDLDRISRQQDIVRRLLAKVRSVRNPGTFHRIVTTGTENLTLDHELSTREVEQLALRFGTLLPTSLQTETVPAVFDHVMIAGRRSSVLRMQEPQARAVIDRFLGREVPQASTTDPPTTVRPPRGLVTTTTVAPQTC
jgi:polyisoprenyl-teichoic acid--peptidoglycan teichoic acid transferase